MTEADERIVQGLIYEHMRIEFSGRKLMPNSPENDLDPRFVTPNNMHKSITALIAEHGDTYSRFLDSLVVEFDQERPSIYAM